MQNLYIEERLVSGSISWDLAHHMYARTLCGRVGVVNDRPADLLSATRKQWLKVLLRVQKEQARTLNAARRMELMRQFAHQRSVTFATKAWGSTLRPDVVFATADDFMQTPPIYPTLYVTCPLKKEELVILSSRMPERGVVVIYKTQDAA